MKPLIFIITFCLCTCFVQAQAWQSLYQKADSLQQRRDFKTALPLFEQALPLAEKEFGKNSENYLKTRNGVGNCMSYTKDKDQAESYLKENVELSAKFNKKSAIHIGLLINLGAFYANQKGDYLSAESLFKESLALSQEALGTKHVTYVSSIFYLAGVNRDIGRYTDAERLYKQSVELFKDIYGTKHGNYANAINSLAQLYRDMSQYALAEPLYKESIQIRKEVVGDKHPDYAGSLNSLAVLQQEKGNYAMAELLYKTAIDITRNASGAKDLYYAISLGNLGVLYRNMGIYDAAEQVVNQAMQIFKEILGTNHPRYALWIENLAGIQRGKGNPEVAEPLFKEALAVLKGTVGVSHQYYGSCLNNLAALYSETGQYALAESIYQEALDTQTKNFGKVHMSTISAMNNLAMQYFATGNHELSTPMLIETMELARTILGKEHVLFIEAVVNLSSQYQILKQYDKALPLITKACSLSKDVIAKNFPFLSEKEKADYYKSQIEEGFNKFNAFAITQTGLNAELYDQQLFSKGILLSSSQKMKSRILNSKDSSLIATYNQWTNLRFSLAKYAQMEKSKLDAANINLDSLENKANSLEKDLSLKSEAFASITDDKVPTWQDVQKQLKKNEAAIELVRINKFGIAKIVTDTSAQKVSGKFPEYKVHDLTDSIHYAALIVTTKSKEPELVLLKNGNDLETLYATYQKNAIAFQQEDTASYKQFWQPIGQKLKEMGIKKGGKVFLSPDGVYNQISLNTLFNPKTKKYLMDELEIHTVTNTKDILAFGKAENKNLKAELIGFPSYDLDQNTWANLSNEAAEADAFASRSFSAGFQTVSMLPGTQLEIVNIQSILGQNGYQSGISIAEKATEESVKAVQNPKILHIATHGFFIGANEKNEKIDPMLRSGLLLAGCSNYAKAEEKPQTEDGILTALEAANLELDETDLVVLSACETGLGDVKAGEGVYGLQRAFRVAGAKSILISLWKVDDAATQKLMTSFYKNLSKLDNARLAFKVAQKEIRKEYPDPYFWGAFVLVGE